MNKKHILLLSEIFPPEVGGSGRWFWEVYSRLPREQVTIAAGQHPEAESFDESNELNIHRVVSRPGNWEWIGIKGMRAYLGAIRQVLKIIRSQQVGMIHCGRVLPEGVIANIVRQLTGVPFCCYVHGEDITWAQASREHTFLVKRVLKRCQLIVANSQNSADLLVNEWDFPPEKVKVIHPGVDTTYFSPAERNPAIRSELGWSDRPVIITVGRLMRRKGHDMMIRAVADIRKQIPDVLYSIIGDGAEKERLLGIVQEEGVSDNVEFRGETTDQQLLHCYQQCDLFALPNRQHEQDIEGFGMVLVEAQSCGKPVIAGDSGGTRETMIVGKTGSIVDCTQVEPLVEQTVAFLKDNELRERMGSAARKHVVSTLDWDAVATAIHKLV